MEELISLDIEIHNEALITPAMTPNQLEALKIDIEKNGQLDAITTYRGKVIDGRNRVNAMKKLGLTEIKATAIPTNSTLADVRKLVKSKEIRRQQTPTQLAIYSFKQLELAKANGIKLTQDEVAKANGVGSKSIGLVKKINKSRPDLLIQLYSGAKIKMEGSHTTTDNLRVISEMVVASNTKPAAGIEERSELTTDEEGIAYKYLEILSKESQLVQLFISKRIYAEMHKDD